MSLIELESEADRKIHRNSRRTFPLISAPRSESARAGKCLIIIQFQRPSFQFREVGKESARNQTN